jgi:cytochrome c peroxidase
MPRSAVEHGGDPTQYAHLIAKHYAVEYQALFGPLPEFGSLPPHAGPVADPTVAAAWEALLEGRREAVNMVFANVGRAIAAYERTILPPETRFYRWVAAEDFPAPGLLSEDEIAGLRLFLGKGECVNGHNGPLLTGNHFHNTGVQPVAGLPDHMGRAAGVRLVQQDVASGCGGPSALHARGTDRTLDEVLAHYATAPEAPEGHSELLPKNFDRHRTGTDHRVPCHTRFTTTRHGADFRGTVSRS